MGVDSEVKTSCVANLDRGLFVYTMLLPLRRKRIHLRSLQELIHRLLKLSSLEAKRVPCITERILLRKVGLSKPLWGAVEEAAAPIIIYPGRICQSIYQKVLCQALSWLSFQLWMRPHIGQSF